VILGATGVASSSAAGGGQYVGGAVEPQFGVAVASDGSAAGDSSTIGVTVRRTVEDGHPVITIAPRD
jgi:hypothetical protein